MTNKKTTLMDYLEAWLERDIRWNVKPNTYTAYRGYAYNHIAKSAAAGERLADLTSDGIKKLVQGLKSNKDGEKLSPKSVRLIFTMLKSALGRALGDGHIQSDLCAKVKLPKNVQTEAESLSDSEQKRLEDAVMKSNNGKAFGVLICLYSGIRLGELCALKWEDIDFSSREMRIRRSISRITLHNGKKGTPKTRIAEDTPKTERSRRIITLPAFLIPMLRQRKAESRSAYVISGDCGRPVQPRTMQDVFYRLIKNAGLSRTNFHTLRHTFATRAIQLGIDISTVSAILGHSNTSVTYNLYVHCFRDQQINAAKIFDRFHREKALKRIKKYRPDEADNPKCLDCI